MKQFLILIFLPLTLAITDSHSHNFTYTHKGADWKDVCQTGKEQSPINIIPNQTTCNSNLTLDIKFNLTPEDVFLHDNGHSLQDAVTLDFSTLHGYNVDGVQATYNSLQFHFHAPAEHTLNGRVFDLEMHIVHNISANDLHLTSSELLNRSLAVFGVLFEIDDQAAANPFIEALHFEKDETNLTVDFNALFVPQLSVPLTYFTYKGSLTSPECGESINWFVMETPLKLTTSQLAKFTSRYANNYTFAQGNGNSRPVQPLNGRQVKHGGKTCESKQKTVLDYVWICAIVGEAIVVFVACFAVSFCKKKAASNSGYRKLSEYKDRKTSNDQGLLLTAVGATDNAV